MLQPGKSPVPYVLITLNNVEKDAHVKGLDIRKLEDPNNNGRKIFASSIMSHKGEALIDKEEWRAPAIYPTGDGGIEISTFTEFSCQDRHRHERGTEIYTVLRGQLQLYINDGEIQTLKEGDEIVILPGTVHQVCKPIYRLGKKDNFELVVRVHSISCYGEDDKYVQMTPDGEWLKWRSLSVQQRKNAYKL